MMELPYYFSLNSIYKQYVHVFNFYDLFFWRLAKQGCSDSNIQAFVLIHQKP